MTEPIQHLTCGSVVRPRWILDDDGEEVIIAWCETCGGPPAADELSRALTPHDVPIAMILQAPTLRKVD
jgi:hypothetical protein